ncbi:MAG TPA: acetoacetate--CoA ligase [Fontimonas sp.]
MSPIGTAAASPSRAPPTREGDLLWQPRPAYAAASGVERFRAWLARERGVELADYEALRRWSVAELEAFWAALWDYFEIASETPYERVLGERQMPGARWFEGARVNYAEHLLRHAVREPEAPAFFHSSELREAAVMTRGELARQVRVLAAQLRRLGIGPGDHVGAYLPNIPETAVAMMATIAIGAIWSAAAPEFGASAVIDRFAQTRPKLLFVVDGYRYGGRDHSRIDVAGALVQALDSVQHVVCLSYLDPQSAPPVAGALRWSELLDQPDESGDAFRYERVAWDHPLWVLFSSGTTGLPKAVVHSHVGMLLEHYKLTAFHLNLDERSRVLFYSSSGWMMWNVLISSLLQGAAAILYDGCPIAPDPTVLWRIAERSEATMMGLSPGYVQNMQTRGIAPANVFDLAALQAVLLAGSPSAPETFAWFYKQVKADLWVTSQSGGTEAASAFVAATPTQPVYAGEIQTRGLGMDVQVWDEQGRPVVDAVGELVLVQPFPSMPLRFCNDPDNARYRDAYFSTYPGVWRHGDHTRINRRGGLYIDGRSDSLLNRYGVCIGPAEIYRSLERIEEVRDCIIVCCELAGGRFFMPMFVQLAPGAELDERLRNRIARHLRTELSPRHVPDQMYAVTHIPYNLTGKKMEVPVRRILAGVRPDLAASRALMLEPEAIDWFVQFRRDNREMLDG